MLMISWIFGIAIILLIIWLKWFAEGWIEKQDWHKRGKIKGEGRWKWATSKPYITPKKILYWLFVLAITSLYIYIGLNLPI